MLLGTVRVRPVTPHSPVGCGVAKGGSEICQRIGIHVAMEATPALVVVAGVCGMGFPCRRFVLN